MLYHELTIPVRAEVQQSTVGVPGNAQRRYSSAAKAISAFNAALASGCVSQVDIENDITIHPPKIVSIDTGSLSICDPELG